MQRHVVPTGVPSGFPFHPGLRPPQPPLDVLSKPGRLLPVKPDCTCCEVLQRRPCHGQLGPAEVIAKEMRTLFDPTDEGFLEMFLQTQATQDLRAFKIRTARRSF